MTTNRKISIVNLIIYLVLFTLDIIFIGNLKDVISEIFDSAAGGEAPNYAGVIMGLAVFVVMIAVIFLILCGILVTVNILLKIFQISFDKWGFSVPSIVLNCLTVIWTGRIGISGLSGNVHNIAFVCLGILLLEMAALVLECVAVAKRKQA